MAKTNNGYEGLDTITTDGKPPASRMESAMAAANRVQVLLRAESRGRAPRRALVKGLVDGNPPYRKTDMQKAGRAGQCNVNWRIAEYYLNRARAAFYDVYSEAATYATIRTKDGNSDQKERWSEIISKEFDTMLREDRTWDYSQQISQHEMVLYGAGPLVFEDDIDWRNCSVLNKDCIVPDFAPSNTAQWEELVILKDYSPHQLYNFIRKEKIASEQGWDVDGTKKAIMAAHPKTVEGSQYQTWEWHQQQLKNQSYGYTSQSKVIPCAHYFFREFPEPGHPEGKITHTILISPNDAQIEGSEGAEKYLFRRVGRFDNWDEIIHPMYYDNDGGGYHHSVTGMGQKMYSAMEFQNRLLCNIADKTFAPKVLFKPTTAAAREQLAMVQFGEYGQVPNGFDVLQTPVGSYAEEALVFNREVTNLLSSNLSQYNSANQKPSGNPITATQAQIDASEQARLGKTQLNHYYNQLDCLYAEKYRRAVNPKLNGLMPGGREALAFWKRCKDKGVPISALRNVESVKSTRIIGQGSQFMRQQALEKMLSTVALWPSEQGRNNLISDFIASLAGQGLVERYNPQSYAMGDLEDQRAFAHVQIASAKDGIAPIVTGSQNHFLFASEFMMAGAQAMQSLQIGGNPLEVYAFIEVIGPAIATHLQYVAKDPTRATIYKQLTQQWKQLAQMHSKLGQQIEQQQQQAQQRASMEQQAQAMENGNDPEIRLRNAEAAHKMQLKQREKEHSMQLKELQTRQKMELADVSTASKINNSRRQAESKESSSSE